jgi:sRNA-binding regulator protein Hfq
MSTNEAIKENVGKKVIVFLMNGFQMKGKLLEVFTDGGARVVDVYGNENIIPATAISTVRPG